MNADHRPAHGEQDRLERATAALRSATLPEQPPPDVVGATVAALMAATGLASAATPGPILPLRSNLDARRRAMFRLVSTGSAAAALLISSAALWLMPATRSRGSFADVVKQVKEARNVRFTSTQKLLSTSPEITMRHTIEGPRMRMDIGEAVSLIADLTVRKGIDIQYPTKTYRPLPVDERAAKALPNLVAELTDLSAENAERGEPEEVGGVKADVYRMKKYRFFGIDNTKGDLNDAKLTVWADPNTKLPVKILLEVYQEQPKEWSEITMTDFTWNVDVPPDFFKVEPPAGYTELPPLVAGQPVEPQETP
jgi:hypothetical protein